MDFKAQTKSLLQSQLLKLAEGEAVATLPFPHAKSVARKHGCSYVRTCEPPGHHLFIKGGGIRPARLKSWLYQGEPLSSSRAAAGYAHYLHAFVEGRLNERGLVFKNTFTKNKPYLDDWLAQGNSPTVSQQVNYSSCRVIWSRFIREYLTLDSNAEDTLKFLRILAKHSGKLFAPTKIAADSKLAEIETFDTSKKVNRAVTVLQQKGVWNTIEAIPRITSSLTRPVSSKSVGYFFDCGFLAYLLRRKGHITEDKNLAQSLFWHLVANDIQREIAYNKPNINIKHYWRPPANEPVIVLIYENEAFPIGITYEDTGRYFFKHMDAIRYFKPRPKLLIRANSERWNCVPNRIALPFDIVVKRS